MVSPDVLHRWSGFQLTNAAGVHVRYAEPLQFRSYWVENGPANTLTGSHSFALDSFPESLT